MDKKPKIERLHHTCETCYRSFHTERGLERHKERDVCVIPSRGNDE